MLLLRAASNINILRGFRKCGINPLDRNRSTDEDSVPSEVTDRPLPDIELITAGESILPGLGDAFELVERPQDVAANVEIETEASVIEENTDEALQLNVLLEQIPPFPKGAARKRTNRGRKCRRAAVLTFDRSGGNERSPRRTGSIGRLQEKENWRCCG